MTGPKPPIDMLEDDPEPQDLQFVNFVYYDKVIPTGLERSPRDVDEPRLWILID
jgi:hypothetical protein